MKRTDPGYRVLEKKLKWNYCWADRAGLCKFSVPIPSPPLLPRHPPCFLNTFEDYPYGCSNPRHPGNIKLEDAVLEDL